MIHKINQIINFANLYKIATRASTHKWAAKIVDQAFRNVMGRDPSPTERQIVMATADLETSYGKGWKAGKGQGSNNWGAIQTRSKTSPSFSHQDSSVKGKYITRFKVYPDAVSGAADVVRKLFKDTRKQQMLDPKNGFRTSGGPISGPGRGELIEQAAKSGNTIDFSKAMFYTTYYEGVAKDFVDRIKQHASGIQNRINQIASALGESPAWSMSSNNYLPITNDQNILNKIKQMSPQLAGVSTSENTPLTGKTQNTFPQGQPVINENITGLENQLWFS